MANPFALLGEEIRDWIDAGFRRLPGRAGSKARVFWLRRRLKALGASPVLGEDVEIMGGGNISIGARFAILRNGILRAHAGGGLRIGDDVSLNTGVFIDAAGGGCIEIGDGALIGPNVIMRASNHSFDDPSRPMREQGHSPGRIVLKEDVWLGAGAVVVPGVTIGEHAIVGAGAVVTRDVEPWTIVGGVPAKPIGKRPRK